MLLSKPSTDFKYENESPNWEFKQNTNFMT